MLPTPSTSHIPIDKVYDPSEDSFLLLDTLSSLSEKYFLSSRFSQPSPSPLVVEVGTGSGVVLAFVLANASTILQRTDISSIGIDINPHACLSARETVGIARSANSSVQRTGELLGIIQSDLLSSLKEGCVDLLIFNPPYVPTTAVPKIIDERDGKDEGAYWSLVATEGGELGMEVTRRFLEQAALVLSERGVFYLLLSVRNMPEEVMQSIRSWKRGWRVENVGSTGKTAGFEKLVVLRGWREEIDF